MCVDLAGPDSVEDPGARLFGLGDLLQLPGAARYKERLHALQSDVVDAPVARVRNDPADSPLLPPRFSGSSSPPRPWAHRQERLTQPTAGPEGRWVADMTWLLPLRRRK